IVTGKASNSAHTIPVLPLCLAVSRNRVLICGYSSHWQSNTRLSYIYLDSFRSPLCIDLITGCEAAVIIFKRHWSWNQMVVLGFNCRWLRKLSMGWTRK
ncbi:hypothetical protein MKW98_028951, partial [Papaver atlanticum]